jgi:hypothetical protein
VAQPAHPAVVYFVDDNFIGNRKALERVRLRRLDADEHGHEVGLAHQLEDLGLLGHVETLNSYGLEVTSGIILGLDTDSDKSEQNLIDFIDKPRRADA